MATELTLEQVDRLDELLYQSHCIAGVLMSAGEADAEIPGAMLGGTCWALKMMLAEAKTIVGGKR